MANANYIARIRYRAAFDDSGKVYYKVVVNIFSDVDIPYNNKKAYEWIVDKTEKDTAPEFAEDNVALENINIGGTEASFEVKREDNDVRHQHMGILENALFDNIKEALIVYEGITLTTEIYIED